MLAWLSEEGSRLEAIGNELTVGRSDPTEVIVRQASAPAPLIVGWVTVRAEPGSLVADMGPTGQTGPTPAER